jgi:chemotaxis family two-component system response regulator Rcp1
MTPTKTKSIEPAPAPIDILLVEDSPGDVRLTREALRDARVPLSRHVASDGIEALEFLGREGRFRDAPRPNLILLDLNLPRLDGREVLQAIKHDPSLMGIPVVILTTSESLADVVQSYQLHANCFITKPVDLDAFIEVFHFWLSIARLPQGA